MLKTNYLFKYKLNSICYISIRIFVLSILFESIDSLLKTRINLVKISINNDILYGVSKQISFCVKINFCTNIFYYVLTNFGKTF